MFRTIGLVLRWGVIGVLLLVAIYFARLMVASYVVGRWDAKIDALCAANGGKDVETRVYETVMAPETRIASGIEENTAERARSGKGRRSMLSANSALTL